MRYIVRKSRKLNVTWDIIDSKNASILCHIGLDPTFACKLRDTLNGKNGREEKRSLLQALKTV